MKKTPTEEKMINVPQSWLEGLLKLAERSKNEKDKTGMWLLIGYISSAETIIKYQNSTPHSH